MCGTSDEKRMIQKPQEMDSGGGQTYYYGLSIAIKLTNCCNKFNLQLVLTVLDRTTDPTPNKAELKFLSIACKLAALQMRVATLIYMFRQR